MNTKIYLLLITALIFQPQARAEYAWELLKQPEFRTVYLKMLGEKSREKWLAQLSGPSSQSTTVTVESVEYTLSNTCKQRACDTDNMVFAYAPKQQVIYAKLVQNKTVFWLGNPSPALQSELDTYYSKRFKTD